MIRVGVLVLVGSWLPLLAMSLIDPSETPVELSLLGAAGKLVGGVVIGLGFLAAGFRDAD
jgi:hypothetical protein